jgi:hypothetical protein
MTTQTTYTCDGCGHQKRGVPQGSGPHDLEDGKDWHPDDWSDLRLQDYGKPMRGYFRHYCPGCTKRMLAIITSPLA